MGRFGAERESSMVALSSKVISLSSGVSRRAAQSLSRGREPTDRKQ